MQLKRLIAKFSLPLLEKELTEQAARRRTYIVRTLYACFLFLTALLFFYQMLEASAASPLAVLGQGRSMFAVLVGTQFAGIYLFMPAMTCGVITQEKERSSLQLLFLTRLGPWTILFEKLLGRLVPMFGFLILSLPLLAFAYTLGGVSTEMIVSEVWLLVLASIQMGTLAIACSAFCRTTVGAFMGSYVIAFLMFFGPYFGWMLLYLALYTAGAEPDQILQQFAPKVFSVQLFPLLMFPFFGPAMLLWQSAVPGGLGALGLGIHSAIILTVSGISLLVARKCVVSRAFLPPENLLLVFFQSLDRRKPRTAGVVLNRDPSDLPDDAPVAWRETTKRALGRPRYLVRLLMLIELPLLIFLTLLSVDADGVVSRILLALTVLIAWLLATLVVSVQSATLIAGERSHQTLEVLCTTPLSGRSIVLQKFSGVRRLMLVLAVPLATLFLFENWLKLSHRGRQMGPGENYSQTIYLVCSALSIAVYLPLTAWLALFMGLRVRTQVRAIISSMGSSVAWCVLPFIFIVLPLSIALAGTGGTSGTIMCAQLTSPASIVFMNEFDDNDFLKNPLLAMIFNFGFYAGATLVLRHLCLKHADRWLGRADTK